MALLYFPCALAATTRGTLFHISNLTAKAPDLSLGRKLSKLLCKREALN